MHWLLAKLLTEKFKNRNFAFLANTGVGDMLAYELAKISRGFIIDSMTFKYRRKITITEQGGNNLSDYQVRIDLDATNFDFSHFLNEGKDLRFTDASKNLLPYWVEKMDITAQEATIWVRVPSIPANSSTDIYMYYGNPTVASASDGSATFEFFDDFEDLEGWTDYQSAWSHVTTEGHDNNAAYGDKEVDDLNMFQYNDAMPSDPLLYEARMKAEYLGYSDAESWDRFGFFILSGANDYTPSINLDISRGYGLRFAVTDAGGSRTTDEFNLAAVSTGVWYILGIFVDGANVKAFLDFEEKYSGSDSNANFSPRYVGFNCYDSSGWVDWVRVRKYTEPEPSVSIGAEETAS